MTDMQAHLAKIRSDAAECLLLSSLVPNDKREMFVKIAEHLKDLALEVERTIATNGIKVAPAAHQPVPAVADLAAAHHQQAPRSRRILPWMLVIVAAVGAGAFLWQNKQIEHYTGLFSVLSKHEPPLAPQEQAKQTVAAQVSGEQGQRERAELGTLAARVDDLERALDNLKKASAEVAEVSNKEPGGTGEKPIAAGTKSSTSEYEKEGNAASVPPAAATASGGVPPTGGNPLNEPVDQVGAIGAPWEAEAGLRRAAVGPPGCTHFRSFNAATGTYMTLEGRRRPCR